MMYESFVGVGYLRDGDKGGIEVGYGSWYDKGGEVVGKWGGVGRDVGKIGYLRIERGYYV